MSKKRKFLITSLLFVTLTLMLYFSSQLRAGLYPTKVFGQSGVNCGNVDFDTSTGENIYSSDALVNFTLSGVTAQYDTDVLVEIVSGLQSEAVYSVPVEISLSDNSQNATIDVQSMLTNIPPTTSDQFFIVYTKVYDENGNLRCNGNPSVNPTDPTFCPDCVKLLSITDDPNLLNLSNQTLGVANAQVEPSATPTASPTPTPVAYFRFQDARAPETFIIKLETYTKIQEARDQLQLPLENRLHVAGIVRKWPEDYNKPWNYHMDEKNIIFFSEGNESCDASIRFIEDNLADACDLFLLNCVWCPLETRLIEEVADPFSNYCTYEYNGDANGDGKATPNDFSAWAFYFDPFNKVEGFESVGDFNCDTFVNGNDFSIWSFNFTPF